ncbi:DUF6069 family protein [Cellulomonas sp. URHE0023]|uniref:DUF6069 family protein n=1 Tax=Cellulomonas sp. URHE0023 TaxID=1380354 RepID=UPI0004802B2A|nr:DUF6069 family protein [Cellulomonas sp. URHE0023]
MTTATVPTTARRVPAWAVVVAAPIAPLAVWALAHLAFDVALEAGDPAITVGPASIVAVSVLVALAAWGVRSLFFRGHRTGWFLTCGVALLVSLVGPLGATTPAAMLCLALMHVTVAATVTLGLAPRRVA